jgi:hypothetical protein
MPLSKQFNDQKRERDMEPQLTPPQNNPGAAMPQIPEMSPPGQPPIPSQPMQPDYQTASPLQKTKRIPTWLKALLAVIIVLVVVVVGLDLVVNQATKNAVKVSDQFVTDVQANNVGPAYALTAPEFKKADTQTEFDQIIGKIYLALQGTTSVTGKTINKSTGKPDQVVIVYSVKTSAGTKYIQTVLQDNSTWQVLVFRTSGKPLSVNTTT